MERLTSTASQYRSVQVHRLTHHHDSSSHPAHQYSTTQGESDIRMSAHHNLLPIVFLHRFNLGFQTAKVAIPNLKVVVCQSPIISSTLNTLISVTYQSYAAISIEFVS
jgi:hypothetical protein